MYSNFFPLRNLHSLSPPALSLNPDAGLLTPHFVQPPATFLHLLQLSRPRHKPAFPTKPALPVTSLTSVADNDALAFDSGKPPRPPQSLLHLAADSWHTREPPQLHKQGLPPPRPPCFLPERTGIPASPVPCIHGSDNLRNIKSLFPCRAQPPSQKKPSCWPCPPPLPLPHRSVLFPSCFWTQAPVGVLPSPKRVRRGALKDFSASQLK